MAPCSPQTPCKGLTPQQVCSASHTAFYEMVDPFDRTSDHGYSVRDPTSGRTPNGVKTTFQLVENDEPDRMSDSSTAKCTRSDVGSGRVNHLVKRCTSCTKHYRAKFIGSWPIEVPCAPYVEGHLNTESCGRIRIAARNCSAARWS
jgi:hypothetical protein